MEPLIHILHLEDDPADAELTQAILEKACLVCRITRVQTGEEFASALRQGGYDLILGDYRLPGYDGMAALSLIKELGLDIPFIFVSGAMGEDAAIEAMREGATDYVLKQKLSRLVPAVKRALKEAENRRERQRTDKLLQTVFASIPDLIVYKNKDGIYLSVNKAFCQFLNKPEEEILGKTDSDFFPDSEVETSRQADTHIMASRASQITEEQITGAQGKLWFQVVRTPVLDEPETVTGILYACRDISLRKKAEESLKVHRARLQELSKPITEDQPFSSQKG
jgi:PAS domain S-box-containing protein